MCYLTDDHVWHIGPRRENGVFETCCQIRDLVTWVRRIWNKSFVIRITCDLKSRTTKETFLSYFSHKIRNLYANRKILNRKTRALVFESIVTKYSKYYVEIRHARYHRYKWAIPLSCVYLLWAYSTYFALETLHKPPGEGWGFPPLGGCIDNEVWKVQSFNLVLHVSVLYKFSRNVSVGTLPITPVTSQSYNGGGGGGMYHVYYTLNASQMNRGAGVYIHTPSSTASSYLLDMDEGKWKGQSHDASRLMQHAGNSSYTW